MVWWTTYKKAYPRRQYKKHLKRIRNFDALKQTSSLPLRLAELKHQFN